MTRLRTAGGVSIDEIGAFFGLKFQEYLKQNMQQHIALGLLICEEDVIKATKKGKFLTSLFKIVSVQQLQKRSI
jgi:oxygen-independent coproporphyrinogen-3 oxidase